MSTERHRFVRRDALHRWSSQIGPNMTPMVDIVLVILIFFMAAAAFVGEEWFLHANIAADARSTGTRPTVQEAPSERLQVVIDLVLDDEGTMRCTSPALDVLMQPMATTVARLTEAIEREQGRTVDIRLVPEAGVLYQDVIRMHSACTEVGSGKVIIVVKPET